MRKRWTRKAKNKRNKQIIMCSLIGLMFLMECGYAAFSTSLSLKAKGNIVKKKTASEILLESVVDQGDGLYKDVYEDERYFYKGANPNNYITFNDESWRILSVEAGGTIKIIKNESIGDMEWDEKSGFVTIPDWSKPATLNTYLNTEYLNSFSDLDIVVDGTFSVGKAISSKNLDLTISNEKKLFGKEK